MGLVRTLLSALGHPTPDSPFLSNEQQFRKLILWLEDTKIRQYDVAGRSALRNVASSSWPHGFSKYVQDLECPIPLTAANRQEVLEWLLGHAVHLEYYDNADQYKDTAIKLSLRQQKTEAVHNADVQQQLSQLFCLLHVNTSQGTLLDHLQAAREVLRDSVLPSLNDASVQQAVAATSLKEVPLGFSIGDPQVDALATVLRLLYIKDLRQLQTAIDHMVVQVQEYTANPKTDASLGKVGH